MMVFVVLDNVTGSTPRVFSTLEKAKQFCYQQKECYLDFAPNVREELGDFEVTDEGCEDLFLIEKMIVDNNSNYNWKED